MKRHIMALSVPELSPIANPTIIMISRADRDRSRTYRPTNASLIRVCHLIWSLHLDGQGQLNPALGAIGWHYHDDPAPRPVMTSTAPCPF